MKYIHVTEKTNLVSIKKKGLIPYKPYLSTHVSMVKRDMKTDIDIYKDSLRILGEAISVCSARARMLIAEL